MKFCCASNVAIKNLKIARKKSTFFQIFFFNKIVIFPKITDFFENITLFSDSRGSSRHFDYLFICLSLIRSYESTISNVILSL